MTTQLSRPLEPGDLAPLFALPGVNRDGDVSLEEFRGRSAVLVGLFRGLHCPFCRRHIAQLGVARERFLAAGVETVAIVNTPVERARLYFRYHPTRVLLAADPDVVTHRAFGLPEVQLVPSEAAAAAPPWPLAATMDQFLAARINPTGELPEAKNPFEANQVLNQKEGFEPTEVDQQIVAAHGTQLAGQFLIDRDGVVRWAFVEAKDRIADLAKFPDEAEVLAAARALHH